MASDIWMRAELLADRWAVVLWRCGPGRRPAVDAHRVACRMEPDACWALLEDLEDRWRWRGITVRWARGEELKTVRVPRWRADLDKLTAEAAAVAAVQSAENVLGASTIDGG